jgi:hypothetical protein
MLFWSCFLTKKEQKLPVFRVMVCVTAQGAGVGGDAFVNCVILEGRQISFLEYGLVVIGVVFGGVLRVNVKSFHCVEESSLAIVLQHLHSIVDGVEGVIMLGKFGSVAGGSKCVFMFVIPYCEAPSV